MSILRLPITEQLIAAHHPEVAELQTLVDTAMGFIRMRPHLFPELQLVSCEEVGTVAALVLYSGENGYEDTADVVLIPDLGLLAVKQRITGKHHSVIRQEPAFRVCTTDTVIALLFSKYNSPAVKVGVIESLRSLLSVSV